MDNELAGLSPSLNSQSNPDLNVHLINNNQKSNYEKTQSPIILPTQNKPNSKSDNQTENFHYTSQNNININATNPKSFAETTANKYIPKMNQAIVLTAIEGIKQIDYLTAISQYTAPSNIIAASRISNNRFCIFLNNRNTADELVKNHNKIYINENEITVRKLINPSKKITLSNVYPIIPDQSIINAFHDLGIRTTSTIFSLKSTASSDIFAHVKSFRRQLYINPEDIDKIPDSLLIKQEDTSFRIFITDDSLTCFICKQIGHISSTCKYNIKNDTETNNSHQLSSSLNHLNAQQNTKVLTDKNITIEDNSEPLINDVQEPRHSDYTNKKSESYKRPASVSTSTSSPQSPVHKIPIDPLPPKSDIKAKSNIKKQSNKKQRVRNRTTSDSSSITILDGLDEQLEPCYECLMQNPSTSISFKSLKYIIENFSNKNIKIHDLCNQVGTNVSELFDILENIHPTLTNRSIKIKVKKLSNLLFQLLPTEDITPEQEI